MKAPLGLSVLPVETASLAVGQPIVNHTGEGSEVGGARVPVLCRWGTGLELASSHVAWPPDKEF